MNSSKTISLEIYSAMLNNTLQAFILIDKLNVVVAFNIAAQNLFLTQIQKNIVVGTSIFNYISEAKKFQPVISKCFSGKAIHFEQSINQSANVVKWFEFILTPVNFESETINHILINIEEITSRKEIETKLKWDLKITQTLNELFIKLTKENISLDDIYKIVLDKSLEITESEHGYISGIEPQGFDNVRHLQTKMQKDDSTETSIMDFKRFPKNAEGKYRGLCGSSLNDGKSFFTNVPSQHSESIGIPDGHEQIKNFLSVPLKLGNSIIGQISVANSKRNFTQADIAAIELIAEYYMLAMERKKSELLSKESKEQYHDLYENLPVGIYRSTPDGNVILANKTLLEMLGYKTFEEFVKNFNDIYADKADRTTFVNAIEKYGKLENHESWWQDCNKNPIYMRETARAIRDEAGQTLYYEGVAENITEIKKYDENLRKLYSAVENSPATVVITNKDGEIEYANPMFTTITGYSLKEAMGINPRILKSGKHGEQFYKNLWDTILAGNNWIGEIYNKRKNGEYYWEEVAIAPVKDANDQITHFVAVKTDITERKLTESKLKKYTSELKKANETKDKFFSIIAHDLKNPFNALVGLSELILKNINRYDTEKINTFVTQIFNASKQGYQLLQNLLVWARTQTGNIEFVPAVFMLNETINEVIAFVQPMALRKNISIVFNPTRNYEAFADNNMINTVLRNLITNALKFTDFGGTVSVNIEEMSAVDAMPLSLIETENIASLEEQLSQKNIFKITVADTGIGMNDEKLKQLFNINTKSARGTADEKGTGLGLVICKEFIEKHGGKIWAESEIGAGSKFHFTVNSY